MRRILLFLCITILLASGATSGWARSSVQPATKLHAVPVKLTTETRAALEELLTFFVRHVGLQYGTPPEQSVLIRFGAAAVFRHFAMEGLPECAPANNPERENNFLLAPQCVTIAVQRLTGHTLSKHRSVSDCRYTEEGYSVPLPTTHNVTTAVVDSLARQDRNLYIAKGYILQYRGTVDDIHDLESSLAFTATVEYADRRWRLLSLRTNMQQRPAAMSILDTLPGTDRTSLLQRGAIPLEDAQALWVSVKLDDMRWQGRVRLRQGKAISAVLEAPAMTAQGLDAQLRHSGFIPVELLKGKSQDRHGAVQAATQSPDTWKALVLHFYTMLPKENGEPMQLVYVAQHTLKKNGKTAAPAFQILVEKKQRLQITMTRR